MATFRHLLVKEFIEMRRTWRLPTVGGVLLFFAVMSPLAALATPAILASVTAGQPGVVIKVPDPTYIDSYAQWVKNLSQIGLMLVVFASAGLVSGERASGTAILVVTKPVSRPMFVAAKFVAQAALVASATVVGTALVHAGTAFAFGSAPGGVLWAASGAWLAGSLVAIALTVALSTALPTLAAGVVALVVVGLSSVAALWPPVAAFTPAGLAGAPGAILSGAQMPLAVPLATAALLCAGLVALAGRVFSVREL